jgi:TrpR-related protein YerC/YecD
MSKGMNKNTTIGTVRMIQNADKDRDWKSKKTDQLIAGILSLKTSDEAERFLRDLLTESEIKEFANRFEAARLLMSDVQYNAISESTGLSSTTIARISKWLQGSMGGYRLVLSRLSKSHHHNSSQLRKGLSLNS